MLIPLIHPYPTSEELISFGQVDRDVARFPYTMEASNARSPGTHNKRPIMRHKYKMDGLLALVVFFLEKTEIIGVFCIVDPFGLI